MAKKRDKKNVRQIGKQPPRYRFFLNPYQDARFSSCPACTNKTKQRTLPLLMYIEPNRPLFMNTPCRYCPYCDLLIAHQDELEDALATVFTVLDPEIVGNKYVIIGTLDRADWKRIDQNNLPFQDTLDALHDFKDEVTFEPAGGWRRSTERHGQGLRDSERAIELNTRAELVEKLDESLRFNHKFAEESMKLRGPNFTLDQLIEQEELLQQGLKLMKVGQWAKAGQAFEASIAMGDCLPQPWDNLGISLMMQERYDEAEAAWKRALVIDPEYTIAKNNLAALAQTRKVGPPETIAINDTLDSKIKHSIIFTRE